MIELAAEPALERAPVEIGGVRLAVRDLGRVTAVMPRDDNAVGMGLKPFRLSFPGPGQAMEGIKGARIIWSGAGQALLVRAEPDGISGAALVDQSDGWVALEMTGERVPDVLARLCPLDAGAMGEGDTARSLLGHMPLSLTRWGDGFWLLTFRSMAGTAWAEITHAMEAVAARKALK